MEKVIRIFNSFAEAERSDYEFYQSLTPQQRLEMVFDIVANAYPDEIKRRSERVYRITKLEED